MKKIIIGLLFLSFLISPLLAEAETASQMVDLDEEVQASELGVDDPGLLPGHPFYFFKDFGRNIRSFFTFDSLEKLKLESQFANEKLIELKKMIESDVNKKSIEKAVEAYQKKIQKTKEIAQKINKQSETSNEVKQFSEKFTQQQILHQKILENLENQVPENTFEKIKEARENHLDRFQEILTKIEGKDNIAKALDQALENLKGSQFKELKDIEILKEIKGKVSEETKEQIEEKVEERINILKNKLEEASSEDQEKFQEYIEKNNSNAQIYLNVIDNLKGRILSEDVKKVIENAREININKIKDRANNLNSTQIESEININKDLLEEVKILVLQNDLDQTTTPEIYDFIKNAEIDFNEAQEYLKNGNYFEAFGEIKSSQSLSTNIADLLKRVAGFQVATDTNEITCSNLEVPVCGTDEITYKNICEAQKVNAKIAYRGECQKEIQCAQEGEKVNRNPLLGSTEQRCCEGLEEFRLSKSYSVCELPSKEFECQTESDCPFSKNYEESKCIDGKCVIPETENEICIQIITFAQNEEGACEQFSSPCDVPNNWTIIESCEEEEIQLNDTVKQEKIELQNKIRKEQIEEAKEQIKNAIENIIDQQL
jgi:hypothetical protein